MTTESAVTSSGDLPSCLEQTRHLVGPALRRAVLRHLGPETAPVARYHHGWTDAEGRPSEERGGKLVRPALALLSARAAKAAAAEGVPAAVAVELVHGFSLLHDDIMDGDTTRRGRPTAWKVFGVPSAILAGDALLTAATAVLHDTGAPEAGTAAASLTAATRRLIDGQASDMAFERRDDIALDECLRMAAGKTGALLACACSLGAELVGADRALVTALAGFGEHIGLAFQLVDDLLGIWGEPARTGKQVGADLRARKKSLPVVAALNAPGAEELAALYLTAGPMPEPVVRRVAELVERGGGRDWARAEADRRIAAAEAGLATAAVPDAVRDELLAVAGFIVGRHW